MNSGSVGRPPEFDRDDAVIEAARLFWRRGYSGTSTRELSAALGLSVSSIYAAFGSKAGLFEVAVRTFAERYRAIYESACVERDIAVVLRDVLHQSIEEFTQPLERHPGCLVSSAAMSDVPDVIDTRVYLRELHRSNEALLRRRIERARTEGQIAAHVSAVVLAASIQALWHGLSVQSNDGVGRRDLMRIADFSIAAILEASS
ncbi:TetR/AcrR family transcriptional regulator [Tsukamurella sp. 1534]|uniref:TetR/AcrR family transcriptional regulator n=1 Tax=Tsukamurella sp. 1534 TaxID=1151061 RepID=UPI001ED98B17|nr:TetR/AcrR family transcriptional regulator [Tsukamurella sp. 1534]